MLKNLIKRSVTTARSFATHTSKTLINCEIRGFATATANAAVTQMELSFAQTAYNTLK